MDKHYWRTVLNKPGWADRLISLVIFMFGLGLSGLQGKTLAAWCRAMYASEFFFQRRPKFFVRSQRGRFTGGRRLSTKTLHEPRRRQVYDIAIPHGERHTRAQDTAFWGKQKNFNIFSFPELLDVESDLFGLAGKRRRPRGTK